MEEDIGYMEWSPWLPNIYRCISDIISTGCHQLRERLPWNGIGTWFLETMESVSLCHNQDMTTPILAVVLAMVITVIYAVYSIGMIKVK